MAVDAQQIGRGRRIGAGFGRRALCAIVSTIWLLAGSTCCAVQQVPQTTEVTVYGDDDYAPYSYLENNQFKGMYVDIMREAARRMLPAYRIVIQPIPWKRGLADLERGTSFALFPPGIKKERYYIDQYSVPLYRETVVLFCTDKVMERPRRVFPDDFVGLSIGVNLGFLLSERLMQAAALGKVTLEAAKGNETNLKKLAGSHIDCYASDRNAAHFSMKRLGSGIESGFVLREAVELSGENTYVAYSHNNNPSFKGDFISKLNAVLQSMKSSGAIQKIEYGYLH
jgi:polar amino acid transport system substrate-binding protein